MSIVISVIEKNEKVYIASDKRAIKNGQINDNYQKIYKINEKVYFGMTGIAEDGLFQLAHIKLYKKKESSELIKICDNLSLKQFEKLAISLVGINENKNCFIWQKNNQDLKTFEIGKEETINYSINSNDNIDLYSDFFKTQLLKGNSVIKSIGETIIFASENDSSISRKYEIIELQNS